MHYIPIAATLILLFYMFQPRTYDAGAFGPALDVLRLAWLFPIAAVWVAYLLFIL